MEWVVKAAVHGLDLHLPQNVGEAAEGEKWRLAGLVPWTLRVSGEVGRMGLGLDYPEFRVNWDIRLHTV